MTKAGAQPESTVDTILRAGQLVDGKYRVEHLLGQGGMAAVWAGTNERTGKRVALKVILQSLATTSLAQGLFHSEVLAASLVNHPNVVTVFDVIEHDGMACIVMELLEGEPLGSYIARKGFLSVNEATALLLPAMRGVAAANGRGVIHRDLKPQNIFVCMEPDGRIVTTKVLDFGISVMVERGMDASAGPKPAMGTPAYMSPEHIQGVPDIDARADVYGFGVLLYEALTGQIAFPGELNPTLFDHILHKPALSVTEIRPDLPHGLIRIIEKAMAKSREERYADVNLMVMALEDELMPATPPPRLLTPLTGMPAFVAHEPLSESRVTAVEAILNAEASERHQETRMLFGFALATESEDSAVHGEPSGRARAPATERETPLPAPPTWVRPTPSAGVWTLSRLRGWGSLAGAGFAVVIGFFTVSMAMRGARRAKTVEPALTISQPMVRQAVPSTMFNATVIPLEVVAPLTASPSPPVPSATSEHDRAMRRVLPVLATSTSPRVAAGKSSTDIPSERQVPRRLFQSYAPARSSAARRASASAKFDEPRAGRLSKDDF